MHRDPVTLQRATQRISSQPRFHTRRSVVCGGLQVSANRHCAFEQRASLKDLVVERRCQGECGVAGGCGRRRLRSKSCCDCRSYGEERKSAAK
jgi:hypothetical protein